MYRIVAILIALAPLLAVVMTPLAASADPVETKMCLFAAAAKLPNIPGLKILGSKSDAPRRDTSPSTQSAMMMIYSGEIEVEAIGQKATYRYNCPIFGSADLRQIFPNAFTVGLAR